MAVNLVKNQFILTIAFLLYNCIFSYGQVTDSTTNSATNTNDTILMEKPIITIDNIKGSGIVLDAMWSVPQNHSRIAQTKKDGVHFTLHAYSGIIDLETSYNKNGKTYKGKTYFVDHHHLISVANGGSVSYQAHLLWVDNDLFMYITGGQMYGGQVDRLFKFRFNFDDIANTVKTEDAKATLPEVSANVSKIIFNEPDKRVMVYCLSEFGRSYYEQEKRTLENFDSTNLKLRAKVESYKPYLDKPYYYRLLSNNRDERYKQRIEMSNENRLKGYNLFPEDVHHKPKLLKKVDVEHYVNETLGLYGASTDTPPVKFLGNIVTNSTIYFFYKDNNDNLKILRYISYDKEWLIGSYEEEQSVPRQLWYKADD